MKKVIAVIMFVCCVGLVVVPPVLAANSNVEKNAQAETLLNVNAANEAELTVLPGVGKVTAERIVVFRTEQGPFKSVDDLTLVKGIGKKMLEKIRPLVTI